MLRESEKLRKRERERESEAMTELLVLLIVASQVTLYLLIGFMFRALQRKYHQRSSSELQQALIARQVANPWFLSWRRVLTERWLILQGRYDRRAPRRHCNAVRVTLGY